MRIVEWRLWNEEGRIFLIGDSFVLEIGWDRAAVQRD